MKGLGKMSILYMKEAPIRFGRDYGEPQNLRCPNCDGDNLHPGNPAATAMADGQITRVFRVPAYGLSLP